MARRKKRKHATGVPHLLRQRGKKRIWYGLLKGQEVSLGTSDAIEAQRRLIEMAAERERASRTPQAAPSAALTEIASKYAEHIAPPRLTRKTAASYESRFLAFVEWAELRGATHADQVTFSLMSEYMRERGKAVKARTVNRDLQPVRSLFKFAKRERLIATNPFRHEDFVDLKLREAQPRPNAVTLSPSQVDLVLSNAPAVVGPVYAAFLRVLAGSGVRLEEANHLEASDVEAVDEHCGYIHVSPKADWQPKSYRHRRIPVSRNTSDAALVFIEGRARIRMDSKAVSEMMEKICKRVQVPRFSAHELRRAWASALHQNGASLKLVSVLLGHSGINVTERYIRVFADSASGHEFLSR
jgi:integrase/recombinase XerD